jgi:hypothetical protein
MKLLVMPLALASIVGGCERPDPPDEAPLELSCEVDPCKEQLRETAPGFWGVRTRGVEQCALCGSGTCRQERCPPETQCSPETFVCIPEQEQDDRSFGDCDAAATLLPPPDDAGPYARVTSDLRAGPLYLVDLEQNMPCPEGLFSWRIAGTWDPSRRPTGFEVELDGVVYPMGAMTRGEILEGELMETIAFGFCLPISPSTAGPVQEDETVKLDAQAWVQPIASDKRGLRRCRGLFVTAL